MTLYNLKAIAYTGQVGYLSPGAKEFDFAGAGFEDENSTLYKQVNALILIAKDNAYQIYKTDISELSEAARERCVFKAVTFMQAYDSKQMAKAKVQYGVDWALVF